MVALKGREPMRPLALASALHRASTAPRPSLGLSFGPGASLGIGIGIEVSRRACR